MASKCLYYQSWHLTTSEIKWIKSLKIFKSKNLVNEVESFCDAFLALILIKCQNVNKTLYLSGLQNIFELFETSVQ